MRKSLLIFTIAMLLGVASVFGQSGTVGNIYWSINNNTLTMSGVDGSTVDFFYYNNTGSTAPWCEYNFTTVNIENGVTYIGNNFFRGCNNLTSVTFGNSVETIGEDAFRGCGLTGTLTIPNSVTTIRGGAFRNCSGLTIVNFNPTNCTSMGSSTNTVFSGCDYLSTLNIGNDVLHIPSNAFKDCDGITSVTIGSALISIGNLPLNRDRLAQIIVSEQNQNYSSIDGVLFNKDKTTILQFPAAKSEISYNIPNSVTTIEDSAFDGCGNVKSITIPNSVTTIGELAFRGCSGLTGTLIIPNSVTTIGELAFQFCSGLISVIIPNSVTSIGYGAFFGCSGLTSVTIPNSIKTIEYATFQDCSSLTSITIGNSVTTIEPLVFMNCNNLKSIICYAINPPEIPDNFADWVPENISVSVPCDSEGNYKQATGWKAFTNYTNCLSAAGLNKVTETNINIYPNPASNKFYIEAEGYEQVKIYDMLGKEVLSIGKGKEIEISDLTKGVYNVSLISKGKTIITKKFIKE